VSANLRRIVAPTVEPVTVDDVKLHAHIDHSIEDDIIYGWIKAAREAAENYQWRAYYTQQWEVTLDEWPDCPFMLPRPPLLSIDSIKYYDTLNNEYDFDLNDLIIDTSSEPGRTCLAYGITWPSITLRKINSIKILCTCGYGDSNGTTTTPGPDFIVEAIPEAVKHAIYLYCTWRNENRAGETEVPRQFFDLLRPDRIHIYG
jgi:uncharacterized phiE125 gp8 family phage protein